MAVSRLSHPTKNAPPAYTFRAKTNEINSSKHYPGPGYYEIDRELKKNLAKFASEDRDAEFKR
jgi:hypothetical protein